MINKLANKINMAGMHKVALQILKEKGTDYGKPEELDIVKAASILGTKLVMINRENKNIINGLSQLK